MRLPTSLFAAMATAGLLISGNARAERASPPKPHVSSPPKPHVSSPPKPQHETPAKPTSSNNAAKTRNAAVEGSSPGPVESSVRPVHETHHGFVNHYYRSYRQRLYPHHTRNNAQLQAGLKHVINLKADLDTLAQQGQATQKQKDILHRDLLAVVEKGASQPPRTRSGSSPTPWPI